MIKTHGYAAQSATTAPHRLTTSTANRGPTTSTSPSISAAFAIPTSIRPATSGTTPCTPMVPGHEIVGTVKAVGADVKKFKVGDTAAIGCMVDSCRNCPSCNAGEEQYCEKHETVFTYNSKDKQGNLTFGGYGDNIVADEAFVLKVPASLDPAASAPLLCAGVTTYSPLKHWGAGPGKKIGVVGLGGARPHGA